MFVIYAAITPDMKVHTQYATDAKLTQTMRIIKMSKPELTKQREERDRKKFVENVKNSTPVLVIKGAWIFAEGVSLLIASLFAIYSGLYGELPIWGRYGLIISGSFVLIPAALLISKFFRNAAKA